MRSRIPAKLIGKVLFRTPDLIPFIAKNLYHKHIRADWDYKRGDGVASKPPIQLSLRITNACNHRCAVCGQYGTHGYMKTEKGKELMKVLPVERYKELIDEMAKYKPILYITGGEPFLYPGLFEIARYAKKKGLVFTIVTNGVKLKENAEKIVKEKWDSILVSLDGPEEIHDSCRNVKGAYKTSVEGLLELQKYKKKYHTKKPYVMTSTTISSVNAGCLEETMKIGERIKPDLMVLYLSWFTSEDIGKRQTEIVNKEFGIEPYTWKSYINNFSKKDADLFREALMGIKKKKWLFEYMIIPDVGDKNYAKYYLEHNNYFGYSKCAAPFIMADIMPNGDVVTCRDFVDIKVGNINEKPLLEIWNGSGFVKFRKLLIKHKGILPQCSRCCGLMGF